MQVYNLDPRGRAVQRRRGLKQSFLIYGLVVFGVLALANRDDFSFFGVIGLAAGAASGVLVAGLVIWAGLRNLHAQWATYQLTLMASGSCATRPCSGCPD